MENKIKSICCECKAKNSYKMINTVELKKKVKESKKPICYNCYSELVN